MSMGPREQSVRTRVATGGILLLVFVAGIAIGFAVDRWTGGAVLASEVREEKRNEEGGGRSRIIDRVDLSETQKIAVDSILEHHRQEMADLQDYYHPLYWGIVDSTRQSIKQVLSEEQKVRYDSLLIINDERRRDGPPPPPPPPAQ